MAFLLNGRNLFAAVAFTLALNYKQMELYHAIPVFCYLLAAARARRGPMAQLFCLAKIGGVTVATFALLW